MYNVFESMDQKDHEQIVFCHDSDTKLKAIIAIHDTSIGPALGGCRMWKYSSEKDALTDVDKESLKKVVNDFKAEVLGLDDIYAPCALGATLNDFTIPKLKCSIIAGAANTQLEKESKHADMIENRDIMYAPDYAINAGGLINVANEIEGYNRERAFSQAQSIYDTLMGIFDLADSEKISTHMAASKVAKRRMKDIAKLKNIYLPRKNVMGKRDRN